MSEKTRDPSRSGSGILNPGRCEWIEGVQTLADVAQERADQSTQGADFRFLFVSEDELPSSFPFRPRGDDACVAFNYKEALEIGRRSANALAASGVERGDKVLIVLPTGPGFLAAFLGCQVLGAIPVPAVPPYSLKTIDEYVARVARLAVNARAVAVVTIEKLLPVFRVARGVSAEARRCFSRVLLARDLLAEETPIGYAPEPDPDAPALIQYTSGSTGNPKGVVLTHRNLLANVRAIGLGAGFRPGDVALAWLPLYHDMGLIGHLVAAHVWGMPVVLMPPEVFVKRPKEWLRAISRYRGTCSASPNFGYSLCTKKLRDEDVAGLDLSSWRVAFCGAEPIAPETVRGFTDRFSSVGFNPGTFFPVYGMAELSLAATFPPHGRPPVFDRIDRDAFEKTGRAEPVAEGHPAERTMTWVSVGSAVPGHEVRVVSKENGEMAPGLVLGERQEGEVQVRGPSLMKGYFENPVATAEAIRDGWLRTGDLGYVANGELYVTGRSKEIIIKGGKNLYPQDIERAASAVEGIRPGCSAAFGVMNPTRGTEDLILVSETKGSPDGDEADRLATAVKRAVYEATGASPDEVVLVPAGSVPKTSSGKIQRDLARKRFVAGELIPPGASLGTLARLKLAQVFEGIRGMGRRR